MKLYHWLFPIGFWQLESCVSIVSYKIFMIVEKRFGMFDLYLIDINLGVLIAYMLIPLLNFKRPKVFQLCWLYTLQWIVILFIKTSSKYSLYFITFCQSSTMIFFSFIHQWQKNVFLLNYCSFTFSKLLNSEQKTGLEHFSPSCLLRAAQDHIRGELYFLCKQVGM